MLLSNRKISNRYLKITADSTLIMLPFFLVCVWLSVHSFFVLFLSSSFPLFLLSSLFIFSPPSSLLSALLFSSFFSQFHHISYFLSYSPASFPLSPHSLLSPFFLFSSFSSFNVSPFYLPVNINGWWSFSISFVFVLQLLDKLETKMKGTCVEGVIPRLFEGKTVVSFGRSKSVLWNGGLCNALFWMS